MKVGRLLEFEPIKNFLLKRRGSTIDNLVFRLHYKGTVFLLIAFCLAVTAKQFFGHPIDCIVTVNDEEDENELAYEKVVNRYCWIHTTFSVNGAWRKPVGEEVPYPGIDKREPESEVTYHAYYQWVCFVLLLQSLAFYLPHLLWKYLEGNTTRRLVNGLDSILLPAEERLSKVCQVVEYLSQTTYTHTLRFWAYVFCECLNLVNIIVQMLLVDRFLGGQFATYGLEILRWKDWVQFPVTLDPMLKVFPRLTKCTFHQFGASGDLQKHDTLCVLPINIVNEKGYTALWFWFYFLALLSILGTLYRILVITFPCLQVLVLKSNSDRKLPKRDIQTVLKYSGIGDWFLLNCLAKNMSKQNFADVLKGLKVKIQEKDKIL